MTQIELAQRIVALNPKLENLKVDRVEILDGAPMARIHFADGEFIEVSGLFAAQLKAAEDHMTRRVVIFDESDKFEDGPPIPPYPINPATGKPYFELQEGFGTGWEAGSLVGYSGGDGEMYIDGLPTATVKPGSHRDELRGVTDDGNGNLIDRAGNIVGTISYATGWWCINRAPS